MNKFEAILIISWGGQASSSYKFRYKNIFDLHGFEIDQPEAMDIKTSDYN
jgi:hypothetical protein